MADDPKKDDDLYKLPKVPNIPGASDDLLAELRKKTDELANNMSIKEREATHHIMTIHQDKDPVDIFDKLEKNTEAYDKQEAEAGKSTGASAEANPAAELVRDRLAKLYKKEPDAAEEVIEAYQAGVNRSKHQEFMYRLTTSGKPLAEIQNEWHTYYSSLPDEEKHLVWQEFYDTQRSQASAFARSWKPIEPKKNLVHRPSSKKHHTYERKTTGQVKDQLMNKLNAGGKLTATQHLKSLMFGIGLAALVGISTTFVFFNEVYIAPFISPSKSVSATPIIGPQTGEVGQESKIIIPKINLEVPIVFDLGTVNEQSIQDALEDGVVHYAASPNPGEIGNSVIVGHSSNNIFNSGKYKFAFVLLKRLEVDDTFFIQKGGVRYTYKVYKTDIVSPTDVSVLETQEKPNTMTLITCDPPGTSINRLIVTAEQVDPDPAGNKESTAPSKLIDDTTENTLPSNAPSLWSRIWPF